MDARSFNLIDIALGEIDKAIKILTAPSHSSRPAPAAPEGEVLQKAQRALSARLMRVNHSGEVAAQALYQGQALTARDATVSAALRHAAAEETDDAVEQAVIGRVEEHPDIRDRDHRQHGRQEIRHA